MLWPCSLHLNGPCQLEARLGVVLAPAAYLLIVVVAIVLNGANVIGYVKCSKQASKQLKEMAAAAVTTGFTVRSPSPGFIPNTIFVFICAWTACATHAEHAFMQCWSCGAAQCVLCCLRMSTHWGLSFDDTYGHYQCLPFVGSSPDGRSICL